MIELHADILVYLGLAFTGGIGGSYGFAYMIGKTLDKHKNNTDVHLDSKSPIIYKDVCDERVKRIEQNGDRTVKALHEQYQQIEELKQILMRGK